MDKRVGFVCFGEVNTPIERLQMKHDEALGVLTAMGYDLLDAGLVIDDEKYATADAAAEKLRGFDMCCLVVCAAGWVPTHAVIRVTDQYRHIPMLLWGLCGWKENGRIITTAEQAGTSGYPPDVRGARLRFQVCLQHHRQRLSAREARRIHFRLRGQARPARRARRHDGLPRYAAVRHAV